MSSDSEPPLALDPGAEANALRSDLRVSQAAVKAGKREFSLLKKQLTVATKRGQLLDWTQRECARMEKTMAEMDEAKRGAEAGELKAQTALRESRDVIRQHARREEGLEQRLSEAEERIATLEELLARAGTRLPGGEIDTSQKVIRIFGREEGRIVDVTSEHHNGRRGAESLRTMGSDKSWCADDRGRHTVTIKLERESVLQRIELLPRRTDHRYRVEAFSTGRGWITAVKWVRHEAKPNPRPASSAIGGPDSEAAQVRRKLVLKDAQNGFGRPLALVGPVTELRLEAESLYRGSGAYTGCDGFNAFGWT